MGGHRNLCGDLLVVAARTHEFGVHMALGASRADLPKMTMSQIP